MTDVRVCGAIGVIECDRPVDLAVATPAALDRGVWLRPFRNLVYAMPPYICTPDEIAQITSAMVDGGTASPALVGSSDDDHSLRRSPTASRPAGLAGRRRGEQRRQAGLRRALRPRPPVGGRTRPGVQRLPRPVAASRRDRRRRARRCAPGAPARPARDWSPATPTLHEELSRSWPTSSAPQRVWCSPPVTPPTSARWSGCPDRVRWWCPTPTRTPRWSTRAGCRGPGWWSRRTATSTPSRRRWPPATEERAVVVTDSVFSADGALAPLRPLHEVCRRHGALLIVDEAHGLGVRGAGGRGLLHELGLAGAPDVVMTTTLSKALGSQGGVVLGSAAVRDHLIDAARPFIFDTGLAPAAVGAALAALRVLRAEPWRPGAVLRHAADAGRDLRRRRGTGVGGGVGDPRRAGGGAGRGDGLPGRAACGSAASGRRRCPAGTSRLRLTARASLDADDLELARPVLTDVLGGVRHGVDGPGRHRHRHRRREDDRHRGAGGRARQAGMDVAVCKPVQTGVAAGDDDLAEIGPADRGDRAGRTGALPGAAGAGGRRRAGRHAHCRPAREVLELVRRRRPPATADAGRGRRRAAGRAGRRRA